VIDCAQQEAILRQACRLIAELLNSADFGHRAAEQFLKDHGGYFSETEMRWKVPE
jgi:hypothetical protein